MDLKIFVLTDDDVRLARRCKASLSLLEYFLITVFMSKLIPNAINIVLRDCSERGRTVEGVLRQYNRFVKKSYDEYIKPTMRYSNIIVPFGSDNTTAIDFIVQNLIQRINESKKSMLRRQSSMDLKDFVETKT
jgi:uridine kinase